MNSISQIIAELDEITKDPAYTKIEILDLGKYFIKARIFIIWEDLYVQVYRNDKFKTTNFSLVLENERIYGRDERKGNWHQHPVESPQLHKENSEGKRDVTLREFLQETEEILEELGLG